MTKSKLKNTQVIVTFAMIGLLLTGGNFVNFDYVKSITKSINDLASIKVKADCYKVGVAINPVCDDIGNTANITTATADPILTNNTASVTDKVCLVNNFSFTDGTQHTATAGTQYTYDYTFTNNGPSEIFGFQFQFSYLQSVLSNITATTTSGIIQDTTLGNSFNPNDTSFNGNVVGSTSEGLQLLQGQSITLSFTGTINPSFVGTMNQNLIIRTSQPSNNCIPYGVSWFSENTTITPLADLSIVKTSSGGSDSTTNAAGTLNQNTNVTYTLTATNNGPSTSEAPISITDTYNSNLLSYLSSTSPSGWSCGSPDLTVPTAATVTCVTNTNVMGNNDTVSINHIFTVL